MVVASHKCGATEARIEIHNRVGTFSVTGDLNAPICKELLMGLGPQALPCKTLTGVVMYDQAVLLDDISTLYSVAASMPLAIPLSQPIAIVAPADLLPTIRAHCAAMARIGVPREVFTTRGEALRWAGYWAEVLR